MKFLSYLLSGISLGSIYAIIALGYTMVYGIAKMLNFAHGDIIMVGGYVAFTAMTALNLPASAAVLLGTRRHHRGGRLQAAPRREQSRGLDHGDRCLLPVAEPRVAHFRR